MHTQRLYDPSSSSALALLVVPHPTASSCDLPALETVMHSLTLDAGHPVALEIIGTKTSQQFVLRATSPKALFHLVSQIHARYPQAKMYELADDPLRLKEDEAVSVVELTAGAASYLSLKTTWKERDFQQEGADPILGILAALDHLPDETRVICQLALLPASPTWSKPHWRKAQEHPLEPERQKQRQDRHISGVSGAQALGAIGLLAIVLLWRSSARQVNQLWVGHDMVLLTQGKIPSLTPIEIAQIVGAVSIMLLIVFLVQRFLGRSNPIYDMKLVGEKIKRVAYRARLRILVIAPGNPQARHGLLNIFTQELQQLNVVQDGVK